ncbi:potassium channel subfamily K member 15-like [Bolinopsis microptera]|uniref:potassium channel subfamily K member 15-like n=1 Tax=Bolinopsis microptera TaxID=2820187 RepID=UPI00307A8595
MQPPTFSSTSSKTPIFTSEGSQEGSHAIMLPMEKERQVKKSVCQMVCLIVAQFIYLMLGSGMFMFLERDSTQKGYRIALDQLKEVRKEMSLTAEQENVLKIAFSKGFSFHDDELPATARHSWDFISTLYFSITSTTTIGYGHHSPMTGGGQLFCIFFSLGGIPLHMVTLGCIGKHLNCVISRFLNFSAGKYINKGQGKKDSATFIVTLSLLLFFVIFSAGSVRLIMGDVTYIQAIYFIYVTISTIGFGDFVIRFEEQSDYNRVMILALWALALYLGMSILSATIMSISSRTKTSHRKVFELMNRLAFGKKYKKPLKTRGHGRRDDEALNSLIMVDVKFLVAQLDLQTDPDKRAEIQRWIDAYEDQSSTSDDGYSDWSSIEPESDYSPEEADQDNKCNGHNNDIVE